MSDVAAVRLYEGDALDVLATIPDNTYTGIVTDPPYGLSAQPNPVDVLTQWLADGDFVRRTKRGKLATASGFLGANWDAFVPGPRLWREVFRVCKPGAIALVFAGTRTQHWMALSLVLAGFEIIDTVGHIQSQGMSKAGSIDKKIDRRRHDRDVVLRCTAWIRERCVSLGLTPKDLDIACGTNGMGGHWTSSASQPYVPTREQWAKLEPILGSMPPEMEAQRLIIDARAPGEDWAKREVVGIHANPARGSIDNTTLIGPIKKSHDVLLTIPATTASANWAGWSTQLTPAIEPIIVARRPCEGTATANVLKHGCGAMNIDACRIRIDDAERETIDSRSGAGTGTLQCEGRGREEGERFKSHDGGRWPKNVVMDEHSATILDDFVGERKSGARTAGSTNTNGWHGRTERGQAYPEIEASSGGPSRFFWVGPKATPDDVALPVRYAPKASKKDRDAGLPNGVRNHHSTVKPRSLMEWCCRLVGHPEGRILDPFAGSGSTLRAARAMDLPCDGIERDHHYCVDLAAPRAGVDVADVIRVPPLDSAPETCEDASTSTAPNQVGEVDAATVAQR